MDLTEYRSQFDLHLLVPFSEEYQQIKVHLREKGHSVFHSLKKEQFLIDFKQSPSHLVIVDVTVAEEPLDDFLAECLELACQTHFILLGPSSVRNKYWSYRDYGVLDYVSLEDQLVGLVEWSVENALERVVLKLANKKLVEDQEDLKSRIDQLKTQLQETSVLAQGFIEAPEASQEENPLSVPFASDPSHQFDSGEDTEDSHTENNKQQESYGSSFSQEEDISNLLTLYENTRNREDLLQVFFHSLEEYCLEGAKVLYFKYLEPVQLLVATHGCGIPVDEIKGAGIRLQPEEVLEARTLLLSPRGFGSLNKLLLDIFRVEECYVKALFVREDIDGLFVFFGESLEMFNSIKLNNRFSFFKVCFERFSFLRRQMELELEEVLNNIRSYDEFYEILSERLEQLQRQQMGLAMLRLSVDRLQYLEEQYGPTAVTGVIRTLAVTIKKFSRTMDGFYRTAHNEFTLLAGHLKPQDATVLAERIRLAVEGLDIPPIKGAVTVSLGVSTYPQLATNAETLMKSSLQALSAAMTQGGNRVGIARVVHRPKITKFSPLDIDGKG